MAQQTELEIAPSEITGKATKRLRKQGIIPANIFGHHEESQAIQIDAVAFDRLLRDHKARSVIALRFPNAGSQTALIRHVQHEPRSGKIIHVDFFRVGLTEHIKARVPLHFVGEAPGVKDEGGVLLHLQDAIEVECAAQDIPEYIEVDVTPLTEIDSVIHVEDLKLPANVTLVEDPTEPVAKVVATRAEVAAEAEGEVPAGVPAEIPGAPTGEE